MLGIAREDAVSSEEPALTIERLVLKEAICFFIQGITEGLHGLIYPMAKGGG